MGNTILVIHDPKGLREVARKFLELAGYRLSGTQGLGFAASRGAHRALDDPPKLVANAIDKQEALGHYRRVRDEIRSYVLELPQALESAHGASD